MVLGRLRGCVEAADPEVEKATTGCVGRRGECMGDAV